jgi:hypothetical protein
VKALAITVDTLRKASELATNDLEALGPPNRSVAAVIAVGGAALAALAALLFVVPSALAALGILAVGTVIALYALGNESWFAGFLAMAVLLYGGIGAWKMVRGSSEPVMLWCLGAAVAMGALLYALYGWWHRGRASRRGLDRLRPLLGDIARFHRVLSALNVSDQLARANERSPNQAARAEILRLLEQTRARILAALRTERVLRQHRDLLDELGTQPIEELGSFEALRIADVGDEYRRLAEETLQLATDVERGVGEIRSMSR